MKKSVFMIYILILATGVYQAYSVFALHFSGLVQARQEVAAMQKALAQQKLQTLLVQNQLAELGQSVAAELPQWIRQSPDHNKRFHLRNLASVVAISPDPVVIDHSSTLFENARTQFRDRNFAAARELFTQIVEHHEFSRHVVEASFLALESSYQLHDYTRVAQLANLMITRYPDNVLTGFAMMRLARVDLENDRPDDAIELLQTVLQIYDDKDLRAQAEKLLHEADP